MGDITYTTLVRISAHTYGLKCTRTSEYRELEFLQPLEKSGFGRALTLKDDELLRPVFFGLGLCPSVLGLRFVPWRLGYLANGLIMMTPDLHNGLLGLQR